MNPQLLSFLDLLMTFGQAIARAIAAGVPVDRIREAAVHVRVLADQVDHDVDDEARGRSG